MATDDDDDDRALLYPGGSKPVVAAHTPVTLFASSGRAGLALTQPRSCPAPQPSTRAAGAWHPLPLQECLLVSLRLTTCSCQQAGGWQSLLKHRCLKLSLNLTGLGAACGGGGGGSTSTAVMVMPSCSATNLASSGQISPGSGPLGHGCLGLGVKPFRIRTIKSLLLPRSLPTHCSASPWAYPAA